MRLDDVDKGLPLAGSKPVVGFIDVALHPGIDDVVDTEKIRWAHQQEWLLHRVLCGSESRIWF